MTISFAFGHVPVQVIKDRCIYVHELNPSERCEFVRKSQCDENSELFQYHHILFCGITSDPSFDNPIVILYVVGMVFWLVVLFLILAVTVDEYFCPAIGNLSKLLRLSENLSGVTLLALGNGSPDILAGISSATNGDTILMYNQILGGGMFVSCIVAGCVVVSRPFYILPYYFLRDLGFTLAAIILIQTTTSDEVVTLFESCSYIALYVLYLTVVIGGFFIQEKLRKYVKIDKKNDVDWSELRCNKGEEDEEIFWKEDPILEDEIEEDLEPPTVGKLFRDFYISVSPVHKKEWHEMNKCSKALAVIKSPFMLLLNLIIPIVSAGLKRNGWSKLLNCLHCAIYPVFLVFAIKQYDIKVQGLPIFLYVFPAGLLVAIIVFLTSNQNHPPCYHGAFAVLSFTMGIMVIFTVVKEVVAVLSLFGTLGQITPQMLGISILAWGNSLGDAVANVQIARQGFQRMAFAACFAGIIANTLLSMGITFLIKNLRTPVRNHARGGVMGPNCSMFFVISLTFSVLYVLLTRFQCRRSYGIFLILIYAQFFLFSLLCEMEFIHPLGTDHDFALDILKDDPEAERLNRTE